jgi:Tol biopolymer transport system component
MKFKVSFLVFLSVFVLSGCSSAADLPEPVLIYSPDELPPSLAGQKVVFVSMIKPEGKVAPLDHFVVSLDKQNEQVVNVGVSIFQFANECCIVYSRHPGWHDVHVRLRNLITGEDNLLFTSQDIPGELYFGGITDPSLSPDGKRVVFQITRNEQEATLGLYSKEDGSIQILDVGGLNSRPLISPTGDKILSICDGETVGFQICVMDIDGGNRRRLTEGSGFRDAWFSPDGQKIVYQYTYLRFFGNHTYHLLAMDIDGKNEVRLHEGRTRFLTFSSDGKDVVFCESSKERGCEGVFVIGIDGSNLRKLAYFDDDFFSRWR